MCFLRCVNFLPDGFGALEERVALCINLLPDGLLLALPVLHLGWPCMEDRVARCNLNMLLHFEPPQAVALSNINILLHFTTAAFCCTLQHQHSVALCNISNLLHFATSSIMMVHFTKSSIMMLHFTESVALCNISNLLHFATSSIMMVHFTKSSIMMLHFTASSIIMLHFGLKLGRLGLHSTTTAHGKDWSNKCWCPRLENASRCCDQKDDKE